MSGSGRSSASPRRRSTAARSSTAGSRRCGASSPRRCSRATVPVRRLRAHRPADGREGPEPRRQRCAAARGRARSRTTATARRACSTLQHDRAAPRLASPGLLQLHDPAAARSRRRTVRAGICSSHGSITSHARETAARSLAENYVGLPADARVLSGAGRAVVAPDLVSDVDDEAKLRLLLLVVSALPSTVEEKPHCGEMHSWSSVGERGRLLDASLERSSRSSSSPRLVVTSPSTTTFPRGRKRRGSKPPERSSSHSMKKPSTSSSLKSASATWS